MINEVSAAADHLAAILQAASTSPLRVRTITSVADPMVNVDAGDGTEVAVPRLASYANPQPGDRVVIIVTSDRGWIVLGKIATAPVVNPL